MMSYYKDSKQFFIGMYTEYLAFELYLDKKYHTEENNSVEQVWNSCFDHWVLSKKEKGIAIKRAIEIANKKYGLKLNMS